LAWTLTLCIRQTNIMACLIITKALKPFLCFIIISHNYNYQLSKMNTGELVGTLGVSILLVAFALNLVNKLSSTSAPYLVMNIIGAGLACVSSCIIQFWPFVVLEGVWTISSLIVLIRSSKHG